jgi:hypothetical protein
MEQRRKEYADEKAQGGGPGCQPRRIACGTCPLAKWERRHFRP